MAAMATLPTTTPSSRRSNDPAQEEHVRFFRGIDDGMGSSQTLESFFNEGTNNDQHEHVLPDANSSLTILSIVGGYFFAALVATGHHFFLFYLHDRNVEYFSQFWVKNASNALSNVFSLSLALSATCALIQIKWRVAASEALQIRTIDNLFALPSPLAVLGSVVHLGPSLLLPIGASVLIHALVVVNVLAPNSLTIVLSERVTRDVQVPTLDLSSPTIMANGRMSVLPEWELRLHSILPHPPEINWKTPQDCGSACRFELEYEGPALQCRDITPEEYNFYPESFDLWSPEARTRLLYEGNTTTVQAWATEGDTPYYLNINYAQMYRGPGEEPSEPGFFTVIPGGGTYCQLTNATYNAMFESVNNTQRISTVVKSYGASLSTGTAACELVNSAGCGYWWLNTFALFYVFIAAFTGAEQATDFLGHSFPNVTLFTQSLFTTNYNYQDLPPGSFIYSLAALNLTETITRLFANLTLGLIPYRDDVTTAKAIVSTGISVWEYTYWKLWAVYGSAFLLGLPVIVYGLYCIHSSKAGMDDKFSNYLLATRGDSLDEACKRAVDFKHLQKVRLAHQKRGVFTVEPEVGREGNSPGEVEKGGYPCSRTS